jgi:hypothetical protein
VTPNVSEQVRVDTNASERLTFAKVSSARPTDIRNIFGPLFRCNDTLRELEFHGANGPFTMRAGSGRHQCFRAADIRKGEFCVMPLTMSTQDTFVLQELCVKPAGSA